MDKHLPLFTDTEVNSCLGIYQNSGKPAPNSSFFPVDERKRGAKSRKIADIIPMFA